MKKNSPVDILIVGAGAAGATIAWGLSESKLKILCLEQGNCHNSKLYSNKNIFLEKLKQKEFNPDPNIRKSKSDYPIDDNNSPISIANFNGVGGSSLIYSGHLPRFHPSDFKTKSIDNVGFDWPIDYYDLEPYYNLNEKIMGVAGLSGDPAYPKIKNLSPPVDLEYSGNIIAKAFNKLGWHWWPSYSGIKTINKFSKNFGEKASVDLIYWPKSISNGVILKTSSRVKKITLNKKGLVNGVIYMNKHNIEKFQPASIVIITCSAIGTPRLLLNSANSQFPNGLANSSGLVGKNLMLHPLGFVEGKFDNFIGSHLGPNGCCILSHEFYETKKEHGFKRGYQLHVLRGSGPIDTAIFAKKFKKLSFGEQFHNDFFKNYGHKIPIAVICEDLPDVNNSVNLNFNIKDSSGMPGVKINYKLSNNSKKMLSHGISKAKELLRTAGASDIIAFGPVKHTGWHISGTARMGVSKKNSVVNKFGQTHDIKNLIIADSSIFPTCSGVNIMSTIQAVALMISNNIKKDYKKYL